MSVDTENLAKLKAHRWQLSCLAFRQDGLELATAGWDKEVHIWDVLNNMRLVTTLKGAHRVPITSVSWQGQYDHVLCTGSADKTAVLWNTHTGTKTGTLTQHSGWVLGTSFSSSGSVLATASWDRSLCAWDPSTGTLIRTFTGHTEGVWFVDFHPHSSEIFCSSSEDGTVKVWDLREGRDIKTLHVASGHTDAIHCAKWSPDGTVIASGSADTKICIWDAESWSLLNTIYGHTDNVKSLAFNPNQDAAFPVLASAGDYRVILSDPRPTHKAEMHSISPHNIGKEVETVGISPDGSILASGGRDGLLVLTTLNIPSLRPLVINDSISSRLRNSGMILDQPDMYGSVDSLAEAVSQTSASDLMTSSGAEDLISLRELSRYSPLLGAEQKWLGQSADHGRKKTHEENLKLKAKKKEQSARESRQKRTEKKLVDLPTMIAHLSTSTRGSVMQEMSSSSESSGEEEMEEESSQQKKLYALIDVSQKVNTFSQKVPVPDMENKVPEPRLSLLQEDIPEAIRQRREFFESRSPDSERGEELYDSDEDLLQHHSSRYSTKSPDSFAEELGSGDEYCDDVPLSMI